MIFFDATKKHFVLLECNDGNGIIVCLTIGGSATEAEVISSLEEIIVVDVVNLLRLQEACGVGGTVFSIFPTLS